MKDLISKETFKQKVVEGFIIGVMVSLTVAVSGIVWNAFDDATARLKSAEDALNGQARKLQDQSDFNGELLAKLEEQQAANKSQIEKLESSIEDTHADLEEKLTQLKDAVNELDRDDSDSRPSLPDDFGTLTRPPEFPSREVELPDFKGIGQRFHDIVEQPP